MMRQGRDGQTHAEKGGTEREKRRYTLHRGSDWRRVNKLEQSVARANFKRCPPQIRPKFHLSFPLSFLLFSPFLYTLLQFRTIKVPKMLNSMGNFPLYIERLSAAKRELLGTLRWVFIFFFLHLLLLCKQLQVLGDQFY
jgi:hypothetical protein